MQHARPTDTAPREISAHTHTHTHIPPTHEKWGWGHCSSAILQYCNTAIPNSSRTLHCTVLAVVRCGAVYRSFSCVCGGAQIEPRGSRGGERREARGERGRDKQATIERCCTDNSGRDTAQTIAGEGEGYCTDNNGGRERDIAQR